MLTTGLANIVSILIAFLLGSIPCGYLLSKAKGIDIRTLGSGNIGATNVKRNLGKRAGLLTLTLDLLKGALGAWSFKILEILNISQTGQCSAEHCLSPALLGFFTVLGHCYTPWLGGKGGKGVASALGVFLASAPLNALLALCVFLATLKLKRMVSLASITAASAMPLLMQIDVLGNYSTEETLAALACALLIVLRHRDNILRMKEGNEAKIYTVYDKK